MWPVAHPSQEAKRVQSNLFYRHKNASATFIRSQMDRMCLALWRFCRFCQKWKRSLDFLATSAAASQIHMRMQDAASCQMCVWYFAKHKHNIAGKEHKTSLKLQCTCIEPSHFQGPSHVIHVSWKRKTQKPKNGNYSIPHVGFNRIFCNGCISHLYIFLFSELETFDEGCQPAQSAASFDPGQKLFQKLFPFVPSATDLLGRILLKQHRFSQFSTGWTASGLFGGILQILVRSRRFWYFPKSWRFIASLIFTAPTNFPRHASRPVL